MGQCDHKGPYKRKIRIRERFKDAILLQVSKIEEETMSERKRLWTLEMARKDPPLEIPNEMQPCQPILDFHPLL